MKRLFVVVAQLCFFAASFWGCDNLPTSPTGFGQLVELKWFYKADVPVDSEFWNRHQNWLKWTRDGWWANPADWPPPPVGFADEEGRGGQTSLQGEMWFSLPRGHPTSVRLCFTASQAEGDPVWWALVAVGNPVNRYQHLIMMGDNGVEIEITNAYGPRVQVIIFEGVPYSLTPRPPAAPDPQVVFELENFRLEW